MADGDKTLKVHLQWQVDKASSDKAGAEVESQKKRAKEIQDQSRQQAKDQAAATDAINKRNEALLKVGAALGTSSGAAMAGMLTSAKNYVTAVSTSESTSRQWLSSTQKIEEANIRIGRVLAGAALPAMQAIAGEVETVASILEKNPVLAKILMAGAATGTAVGAGVTALAGLRLAGTALGISGAGGLLGLGGAGAATGAAAGIGAGPLAAIGVAGLASMMIPVAVGYMATHPTDMAKIIIGAAHVLGASPQQAIAAGSGYYTAAGGSFFDRINKTEATIATGAAGAVGTALGGAEQGKAWGKAVGEFTGAIQKTGDAAKKTSDELSQTPQQIIAFSNYIRNENIVNNQRYIQLTRSQRDYNTQETYATDDFSRQRIRALRDFSRQQAYTEADYYRQRMISARDFGIETVRTEQDHQREMKRSQEDYQYSLWDILRSGDALAYMQAARQYNVSRSRSEEDYQIQMQRRNEDYARQLADQETNYQIQRTRAQEDFRITLSDQDSDFKIQRERAATQRKIQLTDEKQDFDLQAAQRKQALIDQYRDEMDTTITAHNLRMQLTQQEVDYLSALTKRGQSAENTIPNSPANPFGQSHAAGGYTRQGPAYLHDGEFVLTAQTTREFERAARGRLNQQNVTAMLGGGYSKRDISIRIGMDGDNWTPALQKQVSRHFYDLLSGMMR